MSWSDLFNFRELSDITAYAAMALFGTLLFLLKLILTMFAGIDADADFEADMDGGLEVHGGDFSLFSTLSIVTFLMGAGWMGLGCRLQWGMGPTAAFFCALGFGMFLMVLSSLALFQMRKMDSAGGYDPRNAIGSIGRVYLKIPAKGEGQGQIQIDLDGSQRVLPAVSQGPVIESFKSVKVVEVLEGETLIVEPI